MEEKKPAKVGPESRDKLVDLGFTDANEQRLRVQLAADLIGCVIGGPPDLSEKTGKKFRQLLESASDSTLTRRRSRRTFY